MLRLRTLSPRDIPLVIALVTVLVGLVCVGLVIVATIVATKGIVLVVEALIFLVSLTGYFGG